MEKPKSINDLYLLCKDVEFGWWSEDGKEFTKRDHRDIIMEIVERCHQALVCKPSEPPAVPDKPGWWWRSPCEKTNHWPVLVLGRDRLKYRLEDGDWADVTDDGLWGGEAVPPDSGKDGK